MEHFHFLSDSQRIHTYTQFTNTHIYSEFLFQSHSRYPIPVVLSPFGKHKIRNDYTSAFSSKWNNNNNKNNGEKWENLTIKSTLLAHWTLCRAVLCCGRVSKQASKRAVQISASTFFGTDFSERQNLTNTQHNTAQILRQLTKHSNCFTCALSIPFFFFRTHHTHTH